MQANYTFLNYNRVIFINMVSCAVIGRSNRTDREKEYSFYRFLAVSFEKKITKGTKTIMDPKTLQKRI